MKILLSLLIVTTLFSDDRFEYFGNSTYCIAGYVFVTNNSRYSSFTQVMTGVDAMTCEHYRKYILKKEK